jgi:hypothetical protein
LLQSELFRTGQRRIKRFELFTATECRTKRDAHAAGSIVQRYCFDSLQTESS